MGLSDNDVSNVENFIGYTYPMHGNVYRRNALQKEVVHSSENRSRQAHFWFYILFLQIVVVKAL